MSDQHLTTPTGDHARPHDKVYSNDSSPGTSGYFYAPHFQLSQQNLRDLERSVSPFEIPSLSGNESVHIQQQQQDEPFSRPTGSGRRGPNMDFPNFVEVIQEQIDLRIASSNNPTAVMELDMDGNVRHLSKNWEIIVGTNIKKIVNKPILKIIIGNSEEDQSVFYKAIEQMTKDDGSYKVKFVTATNDVVEKEEGNNSTSGKDSPNNSLVDLTENPEDQDIQQQEIQETDNVQKFHADGSDSVHQDTTSLDLTTNGDIIELEAQGILIHDSRTKLPTHSMWTIRPFLVMNLDLQLPPNLVNLLGFGSEFFEGYLMNLNELGIINEEAVPQPKSILCRICEQQVPVWFIERHSELCIVEHRAGEDFQACHDQISEQRELIMQISENLWQQQLQQQQAQQQQAQQIHQHQQQQQQNLQLLPQHTPHQHSSLSPPQIASPSTTSPNSSTSSLFQPPIGIQEYKGLPLPTVTSSLDSSPRISTQQLLLKNKSLAQSMFQSKKFPFGILQRLVELCDEALQINPVEEINVTEGFQFSPNTESAINSVVQWKVFETNDLAIRTMVEDTQRLTNEKIETLSRLISVLQYSKRIKNEVDELVLQTVRDTVKKIKDQTLLNDGEDIVEEDFAKETKNHSIISVGDDSTSDISLNESSHTIKDISSHSIIHSPMPSKTRSPSSNKLFEDTFEVLRSNSASPTSPANRKQNVSITPRDILLRGGRNQYDLSKHNSSSRLPLHKNSKSDLLEQSFNELDLGGQQSPHKPGSIGSGSGNGSRSGTPVGGTSGSGGGTSISAGRGRDATSNNSSFSSRRHLSPAPYVEKAALSSLQRNSNARFDTNTSTPTSSPSIQTSEYNNDNIPLLSERRTNSGSSVSNSNMNAFGQVGQSNSVASGTPQSATNSLSGTMSSGYFGGSVNNKASFGKPPLSPLLVSQTPTSKPSSGTIKDYEILKAISKGAFGSVFLARRKLTGDYVAIKCLKKTDMIAKNQILNVKSERAVMMRQSDSPYVAQLYSSFQTKDYLYLVMEYLNGGDCATLLKVLGTLGNQWAKTYIAEVIVGVDDLHGRGIIHRDLKPDNLLIDSKGHLKLTDFGLSRMGVIGRQKRPHRKSSTFDQSIDYFRKSIIQALSPLIPLSGLNPNSGSIVDSPIEFHKRTNSVTPFSLSPTLDYVKASGSFSSPTDQTTGSGGGNTSGLSHRPSLTNFKQKREGSNSSGLESPLLRPLIPRNSSETSFAIVDDDYHMTTNYQNPPSSVTSYALYDPQNENHDIKKFVGTPDYLAPEIITGAGQNEASDWWSIGCILFEFIFGYPPFHADTPEKVFDNILLGMIDWPPLSAEEELEICPPECKDLIEKLLTLDPEERLGNNGAEEIRNHPYFDGIDWENLFSITPSFVPTLENPESTDYFDPRGADISQFPKEDEDDNIGRDDLNVFPDGLPGSGSINTTELGSPSLGGDHSHMLMPPTSGPGSIGGKKERRGSSRFAESNTEFGSFNFRNLAVLEKANKDVINRLKNEHLEHRNSFSASPSSSDSVASSSRSRGYSLTGSGSPFKRPVSPSHRPVSPSKAQSNNSNNQTETPNSDLHVGIPSPQIFSSGSSKHERLGSAVSTYSSGDEFPFDIGNKSSPGSESGLAAGFNKLYNKSGSDSGSGSLAGTTGGASAKETTGQRTSISSLSKQVLMNVNDFSPSSSDNEDTKSSALLRVRKRRQSSRRPGSFSIQGGDTGGRPTFHEVDVLFCEPIPIVRHSITRILERLGCIVVAVADGDDLVRRATGKVKFDIIFTALKLPKVEAPDAVKLIRYTTGPNSNTPVVSITGFPDEAIKAECFDEVLEKPIDSNAIRSCLVRCCSWGPAIVPSHDGGNEEAIESDLEK